MEKVYRIFLVDDDVKMLIMLKHYLEKRLQHPIKVNIFAHGENCLDKMHLEPDIIVLDYYLHTLKEDAQTGLSILKAIKKKNPQTHVIMMSGQEDMETALETVRHGAVDYVIKNEKALQRIELLINRIIYEIEQFMKEQGKWLFK